MLGDQFAALNRRNVFRMECQVEVKKTRRHSIIPKRLRLVRNGFGGQQTGPYALNRKLCLVGGVHEGTTAVCAIFSSACWGILQSQP